MKHERFIAFCLSQPWALMPERMAAYASALANTAAGKARIPTAAASRKTTTPRVGSIAVIPIYGTIVQRASQLDLCEGGTSTTAISNALANAMHDDSVAQVLLDIDSPGGSVYGVQELAAEITWARKPVIAIANSLAASAAYWLGSVADEFHVTPGGEVGSIGVWSAHQDVSKALEAAGINTTLVSAGEFKVEGNPYEPLSEEAQAFMQSRVNDYYNAFVSDVSKGRGVPVVRVRSGMGKGRILTARRALAEKMVDSVSTFADVIASMQYKIKTAAFSRLNAARRELAMLN